MAKTTLTQVQALNAAIALIKDGATDTPTADIIAKLTDMATTLANKSHSVSKATLEKRAELADIVLATLADFKDGATVSELQRANPELQEHKGEIISCSRITSTLKTLVTTGKVKNTKDKKKSYYSLAD